MQIYTELFQIRGSINLNEESWINYSEENIEIGTKGKLYEWRNHSYLDVMENAIISNDVTIIAPEKCEFHLNYNYMHPKQLMCGILNGTNLKIVEVISLYNINIQ